MLAAGLLFFLVSLTGNKLDGIGASEPDFVGTGAGAASSASLNDVVMPLMNDSNRCTMSGMELSAGVIPICHSISRQGLDAPVRPTSGKNVDSVLSRLVG